jgi:hypothetical protein
MQPLTPLHWVPQELQQALRERSAVREQLCSTQAAADAFSADLSLTMEQLHCAHDDITALECQLQLAGQDRAGLLCHIEELHIAGQEERGKLAARIDKLQACNHAAHPLVQALHQEVERLTPKKEAHAVVEAAVRESCLREQGAWECSGLLRLLSEVAGPVMSVPCAPCSAQAQQAKLGFEHDAAACARPQSCTQLLFDASQATHSAADGVQTCAEAVPAFAGPARVDSEACKASGQPVLADTQREGLLAEVCIVAEPTAEHAESETALLASKKSQQTAEEAGIKSDVATSLAEGCGCTEFELAEVRGALKAAQSAQSSAETARQLAEAEADAARQSQRAAEQACMCAVAELVAVRQAKAQAEQACARAEADAATVLEAQSLAEEALAYAKADTAMAQEDAQRVRSSQAGTVAALEQAEWRLEKALAQAQCDVALTRAAHTAAKEAQAVAGHESASAWTAQAATEEASAQAEQGAAVEQANQAVPKDARSAAEAETAAAISAQQRAQMAAAEVLARLEEQVHCSACIHAP